MARAMLRVVVHLGRSLNDPDVEAGVRAVLAESDVVDGEAAER